MDFLVGYGYIGLFFVASVLFALVTVSIPRILTALGIVPSKPSPAKSSTYECGMDTVGKSWVQFNFHYYFLALLFLVFDIETVFLYPWAVAYGKLLMFGFVEMVIFIGILVVAYIYAWKKKALEWK